MRPSGSGGAPASAALPLLDNARWHCLRRGALQLPARRAERDLCYDSDRLLVKSGFVALVGRPNAGKSTLLNRLVGEKLAIVSDKPQTTRNRIIGVRNYDAAQVVFVDTPGVHRPLHRLNVRMVDAALETLREVDVVTLVVDAAEPPGAGDRFLMDII